MNFADFHFKVRLVTAWPYYEAQLKWKDFPYQTNRFNLNSNSIRNWIILTHFLGHFSGSVFGQTLLLRAHILVGLLGQHLTQFLGYPFRQHSFRLVRLVALDYLWQPRSNVFRVIIPHISQNFHFLMLTLSYVPLFALLLPSLASIVLTLRQIHVVHLVKRSR